MKSRGRRVEKEEEREGEGEREREKGMEMEIEKEGPDRQTGSQVDETRYSMEAVTHVATKPQFWQPQQSAATGVMWHHGSNYSKGQLTHFFISQQSRPDSPFPRPRPLPLPLPHLVTGLVLLCFDPTTPQLQSGTRQVDTGGHSCSITSQPLPQITPTLSPQKVSIALLHEYLIVAITSPTHYHVKVRLFHHSSASPVH